MPCACTPRKRGWRLACAHTVTGKGPDRPLTLSEHLAQTIPDSCWQIKPEDIEICQRPDGSGDWQLGSGGFGKARPHPRRTAEALAAHVGTRTLALTLSAVGVISTL